MEETKIKDAPSNNPSKATQEIINLKIIYGRIKAKWKYRYFKDV